MRASLFRAFLSACQSRYSLHVADGIGQRISFRDIYEGFVYDNVVVYLPRDSSLYKTYPTYKGGDRLDKTFLTALEQVLAFVELMR